MENVNVLKDDFLKDISSSLLREIEIREYKYIELKEDKVR